MRGNLPKNLSMQRDDAPLFFLWGENPVIKENAFKKTNMDSDPDDAAVTF